MKLKTHPGKYQTAAMKANKHLQGIPWLSFGSL